ncbi:hypothetical protein [Nocardia caishijiensis]|uniref:Excreted virulence factor EspC (Type VII ESX diderm) n=1 Tax=Nocardia caishijiensis TaxID=184756 RepID=A0ABQ6YP56_9NOCA|nr:hypothetical protein [Nocardia caishijiensis]KAF0847588.1 hypothetical protein FNL39_103490 [Nocardia caishijiensis]
MAPSDEKSRWQYLNEEAKAGRLYLDPSVATSCRDASNNQINLFNQLKNDLQSLATVSGLGRFDCADELAKMLGMKAVGGERDFNTAFQEHIEVLTLIRDTIDISVKKYESQDESGAADTNALGNNIPAGGK